MKQKGIFARTEPVSSTDTLLFRFVCIFLSLALLFCGCAPITADPATTPTSSATEMDATAAETVRIPWSSLNSGWKRIALLLYPIYT